MRASSGVASYHPPKICDFAGTPVRRSSLRRIRNTLTAVLIGSLDLTHLATQSLGRVPGRTFRDQAQPAR